MGGGGGLLWICKQLLLLEFIFKVRDITQFFVFNFFIQFFSHWYKKFTIEVLVSYLLNNAMSFCLYDFSVLWYSSAYSFVAVQYVVPWKIFYMKDHNIDNVPIRVKNVVIFINGWKLVLGTITILLVLLCMYFSSILLFCTFFVFKPFIVARNIILIATCLKCGFMLTRYSHI